MLGKTSFPIESLRYFILNKKTKLWDHIQAGQLDCVILYIYTFIYWYNIIYFFLCKWPSILILNGCTFRRLSPALVTANLLVQNNICSPALFAKHLGPPSHASLCPFKIFKTIRQTMTNDVSKLDLGIGRENGMYPSSCPLVLLPSNAALAHLCNQAPCHHFLRRAGVHYGSPHPLRSLPAKWNWKQLGLSSTIIWWIVFSGSLWKCAAFFWGIGWSWSLLSGILISSKRVVYITMATMENLLA